MTPLHIIDGTLINDPPICESDLSKIEILTIFNAEQQWDKFIDARNDHLMNLPDDSWPAMLMRNSDPMYSWHDDWNSGNYSEMQGLLSRLWPDSTEIYIFWNRSTAVKTTSEVFSRNWVNFFYEDEGILIRSGSTNGAYLISNSLSWICYDVTKYSLLR